MCRLLGVTSLLAVAALPISLAVAGTPGECKAYAQKAVDAETFNTQCAGSKKLRGPRWNSDYNAHYRWCLAVSPNEAASETRLRDAELGDCMARIRACSTYASSAVQQNEEQSKALQCRFTGSRWSSVWINHRIWCLSASAADREREQGIRASMLRECRAARR